MNIRPLREACNLSQQAFADKAGLAQSQSSGTNRGIVDIPMSIFRRVAEALDVPVSAMLAEQRARGATLRSPV